MPDKPPHRSFGADALANGWDRHNGSSGLLYYSQIPDKTCKWALLIEPLWDRKLRWTTLVMSCERQTLIPGDEELFKVSRQSDKAWCWLYLIRVRKTSRCIFGSDPARTLPSVEQNSDEAIWRCTWGEWMTWKSCFACRLAFSCSSQWILDSLTATLPTAQ